MTTVEFLVEEPSAEEALRHIAPKLLPATARFYVRNFGSKYKLLNVLENRLKAYAKRIGGGEDLRIVVLVDRDIDDCVALKNRLELAARHAGLTTKRTRKPGAGFAVLNRIVVEELESWFLGDVGALRSAFSSLPAINSNATPFRNPDNGGSWEALHRFLKRNGVYKGRYPKIDAARKIAARMDVAANRSDSFQQFRRGLAELLA